MRKFLSLVLALAMAMSLVVVNTSAKEFTDNDELNYVEAVDVISEIGVVDGYADGSFNPQGGLTRGAAAKIICNLILGPTTAAELHADTRPFPDVAIDSEFAGYIAYCSQQGIISGYADGEFKAANPLTGYAFMKMLLGALGYSSDIEGYVGENWSIQVAKQALGIGLNQGLVDEFNGVDYVTREEAALYAFNTLKATLVDYENTITADVNGASVTISNNTAKPVTWSEGINEDGNIWDDNFVQFAEEYFPKLVRVDDDTKFMEPANTWTYDKIEIGTYERTDLLVESYTTGVSGREIYDLLKAGVIKNNEFDAYLDGVDNEGTGDGEVNKDDFVRSHTEDLGSTGNGVLTKVYLDTDKELITLVSINTWLAQATTNYSEANEYATLKVFKGVIGDDDKTLQTQSLNVDVADVPAVADVTEDTFYRVNMSWKDVDEGEIVTINDVEILEDSTITEYSSDNGNTTPEAKVTDLTTGGEEYDANVKAFYDEDILYHYNTDLLTDATYNVYLDQYGYFLGVDLFEGSKNYVFITGFDRNTSNLSVKTATATGIFLDGTMENIEVNVTATDDNIEEARNEDKDNADLFVEWAKYSYPKAEVVDGELQYNGGSAMWSNRNKGGVDGIFNLNQWYTYTVNEAGVYTLKPAVRMTWTQYEDPTDEDEDVIIRTDNLSIKDDHPDDVEATVPSLTGRVYGEDATVFITVGLDRVDTSAGGPRAITDVNGVYTGVQSVDLVVDTDDTQAVDQGQVYTVFDSDGYVIAAVVIGEALGNTGDYAYILSQAKNERYVDGVYSWDFDAVYQGTKQTLTAVSDYDKTIRRVQPGDVVELRFNGEDVTDIKVVDIEDMYHKYSGAQDIANFDIYYMSNHENVDPTDDDARLADDPETLYLQGNTLHITTNWVDEGLGVLRDEAKAVIIQDENGKKDVVRCFDDVESAVSFLPDAVPDVANDPTTTGKQYNGVIMAVLDSRSAAQWIVFDSDTELKTGTDTGWGDSGNTTTLPSGTDLLVDVQGVGGVSGKGRYNASTDKLYLQFDGLTAGASKVLLENVAILDRWGAGTYANLTLDVLETANVDGTKSAVYVMDFAAVDTDNNILGLPLANMITVELTSADQVVEWYVDYDDTATGVKLAKNSQKTVAVDGKISFTLDLPTGAKSATYKFETGTVGIDQSTLSPAFASIRGATTYTVDANGSTTQQPKIVIALDESSDPVIVQEGTSQAESRAEFKAAYEVAGVTISTAGDTTTIGGYDATTLRAMPESLLRIMEGTTIQGSLWVGVNFTSPKDVNGNYADSCTVTVNGDNSEVLTGQYSSTDGVLYKWVSIASLTTADGNGTFDTVEAAATYKFKITWQFTGSTNPVVEEYTVVTAPVGA